MMENISKIRQRLWRTQSSETLTNSTDLNERVRAAYSLLGDANRRAIQVPADIVSVITEARRMDSLNWTVDFEAKFWNAYGLLSSCIGPAERARMLYRTVFYIALASLLLFQFFNVAGVHLQSKLRDLDKQLIDIRGKNAPESQNQNIINPAAINEKIAQISREKQDYGDLIRSLVTTAGTIADLPLRPFGGHRIFLVSGPAQEDPDSTIIRGKLDLLLVFLSSYLLPMLYGLLVRLRHKFRKPSNDGAFGGSKDWLLLPGIAAYAGGRWICDAVVLGACAFVLRKLSDEIDKLTYAHDARVRYSLRLNIGLLSGLVVGWFIKPTPGDTGLASLSPLALSFIAGYGSDLFFAALDKIVQAFAPSAAAFSRITAEINTGGITQVRSRIDETRIAGDMGADASGPGTPAKLSGVNQHPSGARAQV